MFYKLQQAMDWLLFTIAIIIFLGGDNMLSTSQSDRVRRFTRDIEFDYVDWTLKAAWIKLEQGAADVPNTFTREDNKRIVVADLRVTRELAQTRGQIEAVYADPNIKDKESALSHLNIELDRLTKRQADLAPLAEAVLQSQVSTVLTEQGLTAAGQTIPPLLYHSSPVPNALIVSPRSHIEQSANISVLPDLTLEQQIQLEDKVAKSLNVSTLVVPIGGVGVYPTMVMETTDLNWLVNTIAHEWTHNYLNLRPLGLNYNTTPELRTMNETTASITGDEIGRLVMQEFYPELIASSPNRNLISLNKNFLPDNPPPFDFRAEMHETRVKADQLLAEGKIDEAESYMEQRRKFFWDHGYLIRKLNQAYFAFYGAYAETPGGAAGEDPVGPAVRKLREESPTLADFVNRIAWMYSFDQLKQAIKQ